MYPRTAGVERGLAWPRERHAALGHGLTRQKAEGVGLSITGYLRIFNTSTPYLCEQVDLQQVLVLFNTHTRIQTDRDTIAALLHCWA